MQESQRWESGAGLWRPQGVPRKTRDTVRRATYHRTLDTARYTIGWSYGGRLRVLPNWVRFWVFFFAVGNVPESTGMRGRSKTSHVRSWGDRSGRGCPTRTASVGDPHQLGGGHSQSGRSAMGTDTCDAGDGRKEAMVMAFRVS